MAQRFTLKIGDSLLTAESKKGYTEKVFSEVAPRYDFITRALSFWQDAAWKQDLIHALPDQDFPLCLDLACGTGDISFLLAEKYPGGDIIGLDIAQPMLDIARARHTRHDIRFVRQDMGHLEFPSGSVDIVTGGYALRNAPDLGAAIDETCRALKAGGIAAFLDFSKPASLSLQRLEYWILRLWGRFWGILLHRNPEVYSYIAESLQLFPDRLQLQKIFREKGFTVLASRRYFFGITELLLVRKAAK